MAKIYLISSAEAEGDLYRVAQGHFDGNLTARGRRQLIALKKRFAGLGLDAVYTSDLYRAAQTARAVSGSLAARNREALREINLGAWEGLPWGNIAHSDGEQVKNFKTALHEWRAPGAETPQQATARMGKALAEIAAENPGKTVAVVSHPVTIRLLLAKLGGLPLEKAHEPEVAHTSVATIEAENGVLTLAAKPDTAHLLDADYQAKQKPRVELDFNTDMFIHSMPWIEYAEVMAQCVEYVWEESGEDRPFDKGKLISGLSFNSTLIGYVGYEAAGFIQFGIEPGWITLICTHPGCRSAGLGTQLIGYAEISARSDGIESLRMAPPKGNPYRSFFLNLGFKPAGETDEGREILEKDIRFN